MMRQAGDDAFREGGDARTSDDALSRTRRAEQRTATNTGLQFNIALNYGGRQEIVDAVQSLVDDVRGRVS